MFHQLGPQFGRGALIESGNDVSAEVRDGGWNMCAFGTQTRISLICRRQINSIRRLARQAKNVSSAWSSVRPRRTHREWKRRVCRSPRRRMEYVCLRHTNTHFVDLPQANQFHPAACETGEKCFISLVLSSAAAHSSRVETTCLPKSATADGICVPSAHKHAFR